MQKQRAAFARRKIAIGRIFSRVRSLRRGVGEAAKSGRGLEFPTRKTVKVMAFRGREKRAGDKERSALRRWRRADNRNGNRGGKNAALCNWPRTQARESVAISVARLG